LPDRAQLSSLTSIEMAERILNQLRPSATLKFESDSNKTTSQEQYIRELESQIRVNYRDYYQLSSMHESLSSSYAKLLKSVDKTNKHFSELKMKLIKEEEKNAVAVEQFGIDRARFEKKIEKLTLKQYVMINHGT
jgi:hypothetical protein